ncbi:MAG: hypothetical protein ACPIOQ_30860, partial [Promethearchaeia archaeon]
MILLAWSRTEMSLELQRQVACTEICVKSIAPLRVERRCFHSSVLPILRPNLPVRLAAAAPSQYSQNSAATSGIKGLEVYVPRHCVDAVALEADGGCPSSPTRGLLTERYTACGEDEDAVSMGLTAMHRLMHYHHVRPYQVGKLQVGSESLLDRSKSMKSELMSLLESEPSDTEGADHYGTGASSISSLVGCIEWAQGESWDGRWAVAVCSEATTAGAAAVVALVGRVAPLALAREHAKHRGHNAYCRTPMGLQHLGPLMQTLGDSAHAQHAPAEG